MKNIVILTLTFFALFSFKAQNIIVPLTQCPINYTRSNPNYYLKDTNNEMDKYVGTWKWTEGDREFALTLLKEKHHFNEFGNSNYYEDRLVGYYKYWENGILIADTSSDDLTQDYGLKVHFSLNCNNKITPIAFKDYKKHKNFSVHLQSLSPTQIRMKMKGEEHIIMLRDGVQYPPNEPLPGSTFPMEMVLTKQ